MDGIIKTAKDAIQCKNGTQVTFLNSFYAERSLILNTIISKIIKNLNDNNNNVQLLILGAGYDKSYENNDNVNIFLVDLDQIIDERIKNDNNNNNNNNNNDNKTKYIACNLNNPNLLLQKLQENHFKTNNYTVILLECVLSYIDTDAVNKLLLTLSSVAPSFLIIYDPIIPYEDGYFGTLIKKFNERGAPLLHISKSHVNHIDNLRSCGWLHNSCYSIGQASNCFLQKHERNFISNTAIFDEYASLALLRRHYSITISSNNFNNSCKTYNTVMNSLVIPNDMITIKSRLDVANIRLDSLSNNNSNDITNSRFISDIVIRDATEVDISKIKELVSEVFDTYMEQYPTVKKFMKKSISKLPHEIDNNINNKFWVAVLKDSIIGCIGLRINSNIGEIIHTSVSSNWRGQGIGQKLLSHVIEYANKSTINSLHLSVMNFLTSAQSLYIKMGFVEDGDKNKGGNDTDCYIVHMKLNLDG